MLYVYYTYMGKKLTIIIDDDVYEGLYRHVGRRKIGRFLEGLARPHVINADLENAYSDMAADEAREADATEWSDDLIGDVADEPR